MVAAKKSRRLTKIQLGGVWVRWRMNNHWTTRTIVTIGLELMRRCLKRSRIGAWLSSLCEGEGNHSTSVISRLGLVGGGGAVVMV